jgi:hypothetical protein
MEKVSMPTPVRLVETPGTVNARETGLLATGKSVICLARYVRRAQRFRWQPALPEHYFNDILRVPFVARLIVAV